MCAWGGACNYLGSADTLKDSVLKEHSNVKRWKTTLAPSLWLLAQAYGVNHSYPYLLGSVVGWRGGVLWVCCVCVSVRGVWRCTFGWLRGCSRVSTHERYPETLNSVYMKVMQI